jgi:hypothetical protein
LIQAASSPGRTGCFFVGIKTGEIRAKNAKGKGYEMRDTGCKMQENRRQQGKGLTGLFNNKGTKEQRTQGK